MIIGVFAVYWISVELDTVLGGVLWKTLIINTLLLAGYIAVLYRVEGSMIRSIIRRSS